MTIRANYQCVRSSGPQRNGLLKWASLPNKLIIILLLAFGSTSLSIGQQSTIEVNSIPSEGIFKGVVSNFDSRGISDSYLSDSQNVWFDKDFGAVKRNGYSSFASMGTSLPILALARWYDSSSNEFLFGVSGTTISYLTSSGGTPTTVTGTWTNSDTSIALFDSKVWFANPSETLSYWNGTLFVASTMAATGRYITQWKNRLWLAGISGSRSRLDGSAHLNGDDWTVGSLATSPTQITIGGGDGFPINCVYGGMDDYLFVGKERGIYILAGTDKDDFRQVQISPEIGCKSHRTVAGTGITLYWLSHRGVEKSVNNNISEVPISEPIKNHVDSIVLDSTNQKYWTQSSQSDWQSGNATVAGAGAPMDVTTIAGAVIPSSWTYSTSISSWVNGTITNLSTIAIAGKLTLDYGTSTSTFETFAVPLVFNGSTDTQIIGVSTWTSGTRPIASWHDGAGRWLYYDGGGTAEYIYASTVTLPYGKWTFKATAFDSDNGSDARIWLYFIATSYKPDSAAMDGYYVYLDSDFDIDLGRVDDGVKTRLNTMSISTNTAEISILRNSTGVFTVSALTSSMTATDNTYAVSIYTVIEVYTVYANIAYNYVALDNLEQPQGYNRTGSWTSPVYNTSFSTPVGGPFAVTCDTSTTDGTINHYVRTSTSSTGAWSSWTDMGTSTYTRMPLTRQYWQFASSFTATVSTYTPTITTIDLSATTTGQFISQCKNIGTDISAWDIFNRTREITGNAALTMAISTGADCAGATGATVWTNLTDGSPPSIATAAYIAIRGDFQPTSATDTCRLYDFEVTWKEGASNQLPIGCCDLEGRYWLIYSTNSTTLNSAWVYDKNGNWTKHTGLNILSCAQFNNRWYTGSSSNDGKIYQQGVGYSDDGSAIESYITTKDYDGGCFMCKKNYRRLEIDYANVTTGSSLFKAEYTIDGSSTWNLLAVSTQSANVGYTRDTFRWPVSGKQSGKYVKFKFSNNQVGQDFRFLRGTLSYEREAYIP